MTSSLPQDASRSAPTYAPLSLLTSLPPGLRSGLTAEDADTLRRSTLPPAAKWSNGRQSANTAVVTGTMVVEVSMNTTFAGRADGFTTTPVIGT